jgi:hypothetical protein
MTAPSSTDAKNLVSSKTPKMPHERDESTDGGAQPDRPEIQQAYEDASSGKSDTTRGAVSDQTYNDSVVTPDERQSGTSPARQKDDPAAK